MGMVKKRIQPEDVIINCSEDSKIPKPPEGHNWKEVRHDNTVSCTQNVLSIVISHFNVWNTVVGYLVGMLDRKCTR